MSHNMKPNPEKIHYFVHVLFNRIECEKNLLKNKSLNSTHNCCAQFLLCTAFSAHKHLA